AERTACSAPVYNKGRTVPGMPWGSCSAFFCASSLRGMRGRRQRPGGSMAIRQRFESDVEIPDILREHYIEKDGAWVLQTDPPTEDVTGLKNALNQERTLRRDAEKVGSELKIKFEGVEPGEVARLRERVKGLDDADIYDKQGIEALVLRRTESMKQEHERQLQNMRRENEQLKSTTVDLDKRWRQDRIKTALLDAAAKAGVTKGALPYAVQQGMTVFTDLDEKGNVISKQDEDIRYGKDGISPLTPEEWMLNLKTEAPFLWPPSGGGGAPAMHGGVGEGIDGNALPPAERLTRFRELQQHRR